MAEIVEKVRAGTPFEGRDGGMVTPYYVTLVSETGEREIPAYRPEAKDLKEDAPLPDGWSVETSQAGKLYLRPPQKPTRGSGGGGGARPYVPRYSETKDGFLLEQDAIHRSVALKAAIKATHLVEMEDDAIRTVRVAQVFYEWLKARSDGGGSTASSSPPSDLRSGAGRGEPASSSAPAPDPQAPAPSGEGRGMSDGREASGGKGPDPDDGAGGGDVVGGDALAGEDVRPPSALDIPNEPPGAKRSRGKVRDCQHLGGLDIDGRCKDCGELIDVREPF